MTFEQAAVKIENEPEFAKLRSEILGAFAAERVEAFLRQVRKSGLRIRDFEGLLTKRVFNGHAAAAYEALTVSDRAQMREFYLSKIEEVQPELRHKFKKLYQYY